MPRKRPTQHRWPPSRSRSSPIAFPRAQDEPTKLEATSSTQICLGRSQRVIASRHYPRLPRLEPPLPGVLHPRFNTAVGLVDALLMYRTAKAAPVDAASVIGAYIDGLPCAQRAQAQTSAQA